MTLRAVSPPGLAATLAAARLLPGLPLRAGLGAGSAVAGGLAGEAGSGSLAISSVAESAILMLSNMMTLPSRIAPRKPAGCGQDLPSLALTPQQRR